MSVERNKGCAALTPRAAAKTQPLMRIEHHIFTLFLTTFNPLTPILTKFEYRTHTKSVSVTLWVIFFVYWLNEIDPV